MIWFISTKSGDLHQGATYRPLYISLVFMMLRMACDLPLVSLETPLAGEFDEQ